MDCRVKPGNDARRGQRINCGGGECGGDWAYYNFKSFFAFPEKIASFSACDTSSAFTAAMVLRISPRPCSESNGASAANTHLSGPQKAWPQRARATSPSAVSAYSIL